MIFYRALIAASAALLIAPVSSLGAISGLRIVKDKADYRLVLPRDVQAAVQYKVPGFRPWTRDSYSQDALATYAWERRTHPAKALRELPWAVIADFNGDDRRDLVLDGHVGPTCYRICVWMRKGRPEVEVMNKYICMETKNLWSVLFFRSRGPNETMFGDVTLKHEGFEDYHVDKAGTLWSWDGSWSSQQSID